MTEQITFPLDNGEYFKFDRAANGMIEVSQCARDGAVVITCGQFHESYIPAMIIDLEGLNNKRS